MTEFRPGTSPPPVKMPMRRAPAMGVPPVGMWCRAKFSKCGAHDVSRVAPIARPGRRRCRSAAAVWPRVLALQVIPVKFLGRERLAGNFLGIAEGALVCLV